MSLRGASASWRTVALVAAVLVVGAVAFRLGARDGRGKPDETVDASAGLQKPASVQLPVALPEAKPALGRSAQEWKDLTNASVEALESMNLAEAERLCGEAMKLAGTFGPTDARLSQSQVLMADIYRKQNKFDLAEQTYEDAVASCEKAVGPNHPDMVLPLEKLASFYYFARVQYDRALPLSRRVLSIVEGAPNRDDREVARRAGNLATIHQLLGQYDQAEPLFKQAVALTEKDDDSAAYHLMTLAELYRAWGKCDQAEPPAKRSLAIREKMAAKPDAKPDAQMSVATSLDVLGEIYLTWGKPHMAEPLYTRSVAITEKVAGADSPDLAPRRAALATALRGQGKNDLAELHYKQAVASWDQLMTTSKQAMNSGNLAEAERLCRAASRIAGKLGPTDTHLSQSQVELARVYEWAGLHDLAERTLKEAVASCEKAVGPNHPDVVMPLDRLAEFYYSTDTSLDQVALLYQRIADIVEGDPNADPAELTRRTRNMGTVYQKMGHYDKAEASFRRVLELCEKTDPSALPGYLRDMAGFYREWGKYDRAESLAVRALAIREEKAAEPDAGPEVQMDLAAQLDVLAKIYLACGKPEQAEPLYNRALAIAEKFAPGGAESSERAPLLAGLAEAMQGQGKYDQAEGHYKQALKITEATLGAYSAQIDAILGKYEALLNGLNRAGEAEALRRLYKWKNLMVRSMWALRVNDVAEAKRLCNEAMELARTFGPTDTCLSESIVRMADLYRWEGKHDLAEKTFKEAIASCEKAVGPNHPALVMPLDHLANFYYYTRIHLDRVVQLYQRMADIVEADPNADPTELAWRIRNVGTVYQQMGQYDEAVPKFKRAVELGEERDPDALPGYLLDMAGFYREWGKCDQAEPLAKRAVELREKKAAEPGAGIDPQLDMAFSFDALGGIYLAWDKPDQAEPVYSRAVAIIEKYSADGVDAPDLAPRLTGLAEALRRQGKHDQAEPLCKRALAITEKALGTDRPEVIPILEQYAKLLNDMNRPGEAKAVSDRIERIRKLLAAE